MRAGFDVFEGNNLTVWDSLVTAEAARVAEASATSQPGWEVAAVELDHSCRSIHSKSIAS
jgi:hypothetical protein